MNEIQLIRALPWAVRTRYRGAVIYTYRLPCCGLGARTIARQDAQNQRADALFRSQWTSVLSSSDSDKTAREVKVGSHA
jgi:hypothetical protein